MKKIQTIQEVARRGGNATKARYGKKYFSELARKAWRKRLAGMTKEEIHAYFSRIRNGKKVT